MSNDSRMSRALKDYLTDLEKIVKLQYGSSLFVHIFRHHIPFIACVHFVLYAPFCSSEEAKANKKVRARSCLSIYELHASNNS